MRGHTDAQSQVSRLVRANQIFDPVWTRFELLRFTCELLSYVPSRLE